MSETPRVIWLLQLDVTFFLAPLTGQSFLLFLHKYLNNHLITYEVHLCGSK